MIGKKAGGGGGGGEKQNIDVWRHMCAVDGERTCRGMPVGIGTFTVTLYVLPLANGHGGLTVQVLQTSVKFCCGKGKQTGPIIAHTLWLRSL